MIFSSVGISVGIAVGSYQPYPASFEQVRALVVSGAGYLL